MYTYVLAVYVYHCIRNINTYIHTYTHAQGLNWYNSEENGHTTLTTKTADRTPKYSTGRMNKKLHRNQEEWETKRKKKNVPNFVFKNEKTKQNAQTKRQRTLKQGIRCICIHISVFALTIVTNESATIAACVQRLHGSLLNALLNIFH